MTVLFFKTMVISSFTEEEHEEITNFYPKV